MKKMQLVFGCFAMIILSSCSNGASESINLTSKDESFVATSDVSSEPVDEIQVATWVETTDINDFVEKYLPLNHIGGQVAMAQTVKNSQTPSDEYFAKYCAPLITTGFLFDGKQLDSDDAVKFAWYMQKYYMNVNELADSKSQLVAFPSKIVDEFYTTFFGLEGLQHPTSDSGYDKEKSCYLISGWLDFGAPISAQVEKVEINDDESISIYFGLIDLNDPANFEGKATPALYYCTTVEDHDDGQTWQYISSVEYFPEDEERTDELIADATTVAEPAKTTIITVDPPSTPSETAAPPPDTSEPAKAPETTVGE